MERRGHAQAAASLALALCFCSLCAAADALRVTGLYRCGDLLDRERFEYCAAFSGGRPRDLRLILDGRLLDTRTGGEDQVQFEVDRSKHASGPFWLEQAGARSNSVWLSVQDSAMIAADSAAVAKNSDGIDTYVDLVSIIVEEAFDAMPEALAANGDTAELHCGTSYATALVSGLATAMLTINSELMPDEIRELLRRASMPIGTELDFEPAEAEGLTAPILPSERAEQLGHPDVGRSARLDMRKALWLTVESLHIVD